MLDETAGSASQSASAAGAIVRLHKSNSTLITQEDADTADRKLKDLFTNSTNSSVRFQAVTSLTTSDNMEFLETAMETEQDPKIRAAIGRAVMASQRTQSTPASNAVPGTSN